MFEKALHLPSRQPLYGASPWEAISRFLKGVLSLTASPLEANTGGLLPF